MLQQLQDLFLGHIANGLVGQLLLVGSHFLSISLAALGVDLRYLGLHLVFATNSQLSSGDTSEGLARRLIIVDFKVSFVDNPNPNDPYQRQKNINIINELTDELNSGGIFNWCYEGYKLLKTVGYFTETNDQAELLQNFRRSSNPILVFYEDCQHEFKDTFTNREIYHLYQWWCSDNGESFVPSVTFHREFKKIAVNDYETCRTGKSRGYRKISNF